jgi:hypothetical protein
MNVRILTLAGILAAVTALATPATAGGVLGDGLRVFGFNDMADKLDNACRQLNCEQFNPMNSNNGFRAANPASAPDPAPAPGPNVGPPLEPMLLTCADGHQVRLNLAIDPRLLTDAERSRYCERPGQVRVVIPVPRSDVLRFLNQHEQADMLDAACRQQNCEQSELTEREMKLLYAAGFEAGMKAAEKKAAPPPPPPPQEPRGRVFIAPN